MWLLAARSVSTNRRRLAATSLSVLFGVAFLSGTLVLGDTMSHGFEAAYDRLNAGSDIVVRSSDVVGTAESERRGTIDAALAEVVGSIDGVARVALQVEGVAQLLDADGVPIGGDGPPAIGAGWISGGLNPFRITEGRAPSRPGEVALDSGTAESARLDIGSRTTVLTPAALDVTIVGIAALDDVDSLGGATFTFFAPDVARDVLLDGKDQATALVVAAADGADPEQLRERIDAVLPARTEAITGSELTDEQLDGVSADFLNFLRGFLLVFSGIAMLVATFSINNTFAVLIAQRSTESALLRAVGATRRQVVGLILTETALVGLVFSIAGAAAGVGLAQLLLTVFGAMGLDLPTDGLDVRPAGLAVALGTGFVTTLIAGTFPAIESGRVAPIAALRAAAAESPQVGRLRLVSGSILAALGATALLGPAFGGEPAPVIVAGLAAVAVLVGAIMSGPAVARRSAAVIGSPIARLRGVTGSMARSNAMRSPRRTARTAAALTVGIGVVTLFAVFGSSLVASVDDLVAGSLRAEYVFQADGFSGPGLDPTLADRLAELPEVERAVALEWGAVNLDDTSIDIVAADITALQQVVDPGVTAGSLSRVTGGSVAVAGDLAVQRGWELGDRVGVTFADGVEQSLEIGAVFSRAELLEDLLLPAEVYAPHRTQPAVGIVLADGVAGGDAAEIRRAMDRVGRTLRAPDVVDRDEFVDDVVGDIGEVLSVIYVLLALSVLIAAMGIANTISLSIHERRREIGLLRAVGQVRSQTRSMVRWEAAVISVFGSLSGVAIGVVSAWGLVRSLGADDPEIAAFAAPTGQLVVIIAVGAAVGMVAGIRPARRAAGLPILDAIAR